ESRTGRRQIGFSKEEVAKGAPEKIKKNPFIDVEPDDLLRYGLIPELVGRLPVAVPLDALDEDALMRILIEPKNALSKQYQKLFELEDVRLTIEKDALKAIAQKAIKRGTGARGLRAILEEMMTDIMFDLPARGQPSPNERLTPGRRPGASTSSISPATATPEPRTASVRHSRGWCGVSSTAPASPGCCGCSTSGATRAPRTAPSRPCSPRRGPASLPQSQKATSFP